LEIAYGIEVQDEHDPYIEIAEKAVLATNQAIIPGAFMVDMLPFLKYVPSRVPGAGFKTKAKEWSKLIINLREIPFRETKRNISDGVASPSFVLNSLQRMDEKRNLEEQERAIQSTAGIVYAAGADTTLSALESFIYAMVLYPEIQIKAQKELDGVLRGPGQLPDHSDKADLPYVSAIVMEVLRWNPVAPLGVPHYLAVEDEYKGFRIPAGSILMANSWAILHNEIDYPDPLDFKPERFLKDGQQNPGIKDPATSAFGFGRRICPGRHFAQSSIWITIASILSCFEISKAIDENGLFIEPSGYSSGLISGPLPFQCSIRPRSAEAEQTIRSAQ